MYSLLIAEDESWTREALANADYWKLCGVSRIFEAGNGEDACRILREEKIDFLLSDIRMPVMDGLTLLARIRESHPDTIKVVLTGFDDFEYVRTAMRLDAHDYLLKPVNDEEMLQLFLKLARRRDEQQAERLRRAAEESRWQQDRHQLREQLLAGWFSGRRTDEAAFETQRKALGMAEPPDRYVVLLLEIDRRSGLEERYGRRDFELLSYAVRNIAEEYARESGWRHDPFEIDERLALWCEDAEDTATLERLLARIRESVKRFVKVTVSIGVSGRHATLGEAFQAYLEALNSLKMKMYFGHDRATFYEDVTFEEPRKLFGQDLQLRLYNGVAAGRSQETEELLADLFEDIRRQRVSARDLEEILRVLMRILRECKEPTEGDAGASAGEAWLAQAGAFDTLEEIRSFVVGAFRGAVEAAALSKASRKSKLIVDVLRYLEANYAEDVSLQKLADRFFVNASYLSRLFKEEVGEIFTKYLMQLRIERARELLRTTHLKVYEVSEAVGYADVKYFNKIFKDLTGLTPADHRSLTNS
ncbi:response regulator [Cohnella sp. REN36]|uniref:response regulator n=1 Tax=Cohnella sp. REN36 TaxID=2887347 RepID=UPI001D148543|nr:response regulator [Cohnella sp. REN36]MCC3373269.1 response regulator [Cohnella sp. REN36]